MAFFKSNQNPYPDPYAQPADRKKVVIAIGLGVALFLGLGFFVITLFSGDAKGTFNNMLARHNSLITTVGNSQKRIRSGQLAKINSSAILLLESDGVALQAQLKKKFGADKVSDSAKKAANDPEVTKKLDEAVLLDKFDTNYRNIFRQQLNKLILMAREVQNHAGGKEFTPTMDKYVEDLQSIDKQLDELVL